MNRACRNVRDFMKLARQARPSKLNRSAFFLDGPTRLRLIKEEVKELELAIAKGDAKEVIDGIIDILYVTYGTAIAFGFDPEPFFNLVHENNMKKTWTTEQLPQMPSGSSAHPTEDGRFVVLHNGKLIKPPGHTPPDIATLIAELYPL